MPNPTPRPNRRILVIDDNRAIHHDFRKILTRLPDRTAVDEAEEALFGDGPPTPDTETFEVESAYQGQDGAEALRQAQECGRPFALAFVDVRMPPGWDGIRTVRRLWEIDPDLPVVICTAYADYSWDEMANSLGSCDRLVILKKPFDVLEVLQLAHALTARWQLARDSRLRLEQARAPITGILDALGRLRDSELSNPQREWVQAARSSAEAALEQLNDPR
jgi:CheY-like chemotaxis protein